MMRQLVAEGGEAVLVEVEPPALRPNGYLLRTEWSLISPGTELDLILRSATSGRRQPLGYSVVGTVLESGPDAPPLPPGARLAACGFQFSPHAELVSVPHLMAAPVPEAVAPRHAAFATLGALAIHAVRQGGLQLGETAVVLGQGVVGQLVGQVVRAAGGRAAVFDPDPARLELGRRLGAEACPRADRLVDDVLAWTDGVGADAVFLCSRGGADVMATACALARDRGTIVVVGTPALDVPRDPFFGRELQLKIARAYGPGRYDPRYEVDGIDYPIGYVRWTEGRNLREFVRLLERGLVTVGPLITHEVPFAEAARAHATIRERPSDALGVLLRYGGGP